VLYEDGHRVLLGFSCFVSNLLSLNLLQLLYMCSNNLCLFSLVDMRKTQMKDELHVVIYFKNSKSCYKVSFFIRNTRCCQLIMIGEDISSIETLISTVDGHDQV
jgi:hypothetical protein